MATASLMRSSAGRSRSAAMAWTTVSSRSHTTRSISVNREALDGKCRYTDPVATSATDATTATWAAA